MKIEYRCSECGAENCKLWRSYQTFLEHQTLTCLPCTLRDQWKSIQETDEDKTKGRESISIRNIDQIGWRVAAVPTEDGETYWGYTSVPDGGVSWWWGLPTFPAKGRKGEGEP